LTIIHILDKIFIYQIKGDKMKVIKKIERIIKYIEGKISISILEKYHKEEE